MRGDLGVKDNAPYHNDGQHWPLLGGRAAHPPGLTGSSYRCSR